MSLNEWIAYAVAAASILVMLKVLWSTSGRQLKKYRAAIDAGLRTVEDKNEEIANLRKAEEAWREANRALRELSKEQEKKLLQRDGEVAGLKKAHARDKAANEKLTEIIGNQDQHIKQLTRDVDMLKEQVGKLRAQLGEEP